MRAFCFSFTDGGLSMDFRMDPNKSMISTIVRIIPNQEKIAENRPTTIVRTRQNARPKTKDDRGYKYL